MLSPSQDYLYSSLLSADDAVETCGRGGRLYAVVKMGGLFALLFVIQYYETLSIGGIKVSIVWKIPVMFYLIVRNVSVPFRPHPLIVLAYANACMVLVGGSLFVHSSETIIAFSRSLFVPLVLHFVYNKALEGHCRGALRFVESFAYYIILSAIPFLLGLLTSITTRGISFSHFERYAQGTSFIGVFQTPHVASSSLAVATIIVGAAVLQSRTMVGFVWAISSVAFGCFVLVKTYVRTGIAMVLGALCAAVILDLFRCKSRRLLILLFPALLAFIASALCNEALWNRLVDKRVHRSQRSWQEYGSGRPQIAMDSLAVWLEGDATELLFGQGRHEFTTRMQRYTGADIFAHNGFLDTLVSQGICGAIVLLAYLWAMLCALRGIRDVDHDLYVLSISAYTAYMLFFLFQGGENWPVEIILACLCATALALQNTWLYRLNCETSREARSYEPELAGSVATYAMG